MIVEPGQSSLSLVRASVLALAWLLAWPAQAQTSRERLTAGMQQLMAEHVLPVLLWAAVPIGVVLAIVGVLAIRRRRRANAPVPLSAEEQARVDAFITRKEP